jgi:excisionase family DNA binding protein
MKVINGQRLYNAEELAGLMGVNIVTIYSYIHKRGLRASRIGGKWFVSEKSLSDYLNGLTTGNVDTKEE